MPDYRQKINNIKTEKLAARNMLKGLMDLPSERKPALFNWAQLNKAG
jgi:hypothetical protein